ncbi:MAG: DNA polymerase IV [Candidatus Delongbacteria bacterium]|nr:DNA polymerase IV [Candidatus Delongbacteria bacterium]
MLQTIFHVDMDAFFASIEQRDIPVLKKKPIVVGGPDIRRGVVSTASYEARKFGVSSGMALSLVHRRYPFIQIVPSNIPKYIYNSLKVMEILATFSPLVEPVSIDEAFLDVTDVKYHFGDSLDLAAQIQNAIRTELNLTCSIGIARNRELAKIASDLHKPDQITLITPSREKEILSDLPVRRFPGVGSKTQEMLDKFGIKTIGDLMHLSPETLKTMFGKQSCRLIDFFQNLGQSSGSVIMPLGSRQDEKSLSNEITLPEDTSDRNRIFQYLRILVPTLGRRLRHRGFYPRTIGIRIRYHDFKSQTIQKSALSPYKTDDSSLMKHYRSFFMSDQMPGRPLRLIGIFAGSFMTESPDQQLTLFDPVDLTGDKQNRLQQAIDQLKNKYGEAIFH